MKRADGGEMEKGVEHDAGHEGQVGEPQRKDGGAMKKMHKRRARGGGIADEAEPGGKKVPEQERKRGGRVHGAKAKGRPDRRARGGATSDQDPLTSAGKMSVPSFEKGHTPSKDEGGTAMEKRSD